MSEETKRLTPAEFFGDAFGAWEAALNALHAFAQADGAPAGEDVLTYFDERTIAYREAAQRRHKFSDIANQIHALTGAKSITVTEMDLSQDGELTPVKEEGE